MKNLKLGFTLVELLVVVAIIAILAVVGLTVFGGIQSRGRDSRRRADIKAIQEALETNYSAANPLAPYPAVVGTMFASGVVPLDPSSGGVYIGVPAARTATYRVCADLEDIGSFTGAERDFCLSNQQ